jgi:molybdate transport system substrate-binding protein
MAEPRRVLLALALIAPGAAAAAEIRVLAAGATESTLRDVVAAFERESGHTLVATFGNVGELRDRLASGTPADATIVTPAILEQLEARKLVRPGSRLDLGRVGGGIAVCAGAPRPAVGTPDELRATLLAARAIHIADPARATAGAHFVKVAERLGVAEAVKPKLRPAAGGKAAMQAMAGACEGALGLTQVSEILSVPEVALVGPYPSDLQNDTIYSGIVLAGARQPEAAQAFLRYLASPAAQARFAKSGFRPAR